MLLKMVEPGGYKPLSCPWPLHTTTLRRTEHHYSTHHHTPTSTAARVHPDMRYITLSLSRDSITHYIYRSSLSLHLSLSSQIHRPQQTLSSDRLLSLAWSCESPESERRALHDKIWRGQEDICYLIS